jgi:hypothetical protein
MTNNSANAKRDWLLLSQISTYRQTRLLRNSTLRHTSRHLNSTQTQHLMLLLVYYNTILAQCGEMKMYYENQTCTRNQRQHRIRIHINTKCRYGCVSNTEVYRRDINEPSEPTVFYFQRIGCRGRDTRNAWLPIRRYHRIYATRRANSEAKLLPLWRGTSTPRSRHVQSNVRTVKGMQIRIIANNSAFAFVGTARVIWDNEPLVG